MTTAHMSCFLRLTRGTAAQILSESKPTDTAASFERGQSAAYTIVGHVMRRL